MSFRILDQIGVAAEIIFHNVQNVTDEKLGQVGEAIGALHAPATDTKYVLLEGGSDDWSMFYSRADRLSMDGKSVLLASSIDWPAPRSTGVTYQSKYG